VTRPILILGAGGLARESRWLIEDCGRAGHGVRTACFVDREGSSKFGQMLEGLPVLDCQSARLRFPDARAIVAVGDPALRANIAAEARAAGLSFAALLHPAAVHAPDLAIGPGSLVFAGCVITANVRLGQHVQINPACSIAHDCVLEDFVTLAPGVRVAGSVWIERHVFIGIGAAIVNGTAEKPLVIGEDAVVGAGAVVIGDVPPGVTVAGVPARRLR
jgi:sugar O-acyltransferase (sialic acid O-acetyltransferase NeuD family)